MIHRVYSSLGSFKNLEFKPGCNLLVAKRLAQSSDLQTRNRAGKSSFVQIAHFLLGGTAGTDSIFRNGYLDKETFGMEFDLGSHRIAAERQGARHGRTMIAEDPGHEWPIRPIYARGVPNSFSQDDWRALLGAEWFSLPLTEREGKYKPTFRSLFCYFARRENDEGLRRPEMQSRMQQPWDQQVALSYLLDLDWRVAADWQAVRDRERTLKELRKAASEGAFGEIISTSAQLRTQLVVADQASQRLRRALTEFVVLPEYDSLEKQASGLTQTLAAISDENVLDLEVRQSILDAFQEERSPGHDDLQRLYEEAGVVLPDSVAKRFEEVSSFHESVLANRRNYLQSELSAVEARLTGRSQRMEELDRQRAEIMRLLQSKGALEQFQLLQKEANRLDAITESLRQRFQSAEQLEGLKSELELERGTLLQRLRRDLAEQDRRAAHAIATFQEISTSLYEDAGSLTLIPSPDGLKIDIQIQGDRSRGIRNMQVFCFDVMLMRLCAERDIGPGFLIHDSHLFDGVDERQIGRALWIAAETSRQCGWQYIATLNEDDLPRTLPAGFKLDPFILNVPLTDEHEAGGLFGFRF